TPRSAATRSSMQTPARSGPQRPSPLSSHGRTAQRSDLSPSSSTAPEQRDPTGPQGPGILRRLSPPPRLELNYFTPKSRWAGGRRGLILSRETRSAPAPATERR